MFASEHQQRHTAPRVAPAPTVLQTWNGCGCEDGSSGAMATTRGAQHGATADQYVARPVRVAYDLAVALFASVYCTIFMSATWTTLREAYYFIVDLVLLVCLAPVILVYVALVAPAIAMGYSSAEACFPGLFKASTTKFEVSAIV